jgi:hypothetical protein
MSIASLINKVDAKFSSTTLNFDSILLRQRENLNGNLDLWFLMMDINITDTILDIIFVPSSI